MPPPYRTLMADDGLREAIRPRPELPTFPVWAMGLLI